MMSYYQRILQLSVVEKLCWHFKPHGLYVFNYHRIGDENDTAFDPHLFSCTQEHFKEQLEFYKNNFEVINIETLNSLIHSNKKINKRLALITFDDGYLDNYLHAYPLLKAANLPACFFIATDFIDQQKVPWWDEIAWLLKNNELHQEFIKKWQLPNGFQTLDSREQIYLLLKKVKSDTKTTMEEKLIQIRMDLNIDERQVMPKEQLFMDWDMVREVSANGITIGSHTCSHRILSHLEEQEQTFEILQSKQKLETQLNGQPVRSFAYPVGGETSYNKSSTKCLEEFEYQMAFTFLPGINTRLNKNRFTLKRFAISDNCNVETLKSSLCLHFIKETLSASTE
ncbi:polysaccharide deacetylase family protein [Thalassotalea fonticola]|uniref:Polysaccharide deacetylase family protein n=1 Tax=Thalassotalea fonticola TaxID=3065649 RepID=A0ABZ0GL60_9GAMM|nr:polysaccharide deacetylase family protein [Colwelliaceae bacterium S1-1]